MVLSEVSNLETGVRFPLAAPLFTMSIKKSRQLGENYSSASNKLRRKIMFSLIQECNKNRCHRCGKPMTESDFSIDHKKAWQNSANPKDLFWSMKNISFSHLRCNVGAAKMIPRTKGARMRSYIEDDEAFLIQKKRAKGATLRSLAEQHCVSHRTIGRVLKR